MYQYQVSFSEAIKRAFSNYCCFTGRASRSEYWWFVLFITIVNFILNFGSGVITGFAIANGDTPDDFNFFTILQLIWYLVTFLPSLGLQFRRLHDTDRSGWNTLWSLLPCIGWILLIVYFCQDSEPEENAYGPIPNLIEE